MATLNVPGRCHFDSDGWLRGPISITHLFTPNHGTGFGNGQGVVFHTEAGFEAGTVATFMNRANGVSAFFSVGQSGAATQYLPVGRGLSAWSQVAGNDSYRGIEDEDRTHPSVPLTPAQLAAFAQIFEACSEFDGFPLQIANSPGERGLILHSQGGQNWGGHLQCPGPVRAAQRPAIVALAKAIRAGGNPAPVPAARQWKSLGQLTLAALCAADLHEPASTVLTKTAQASPNGRYVASLVSHVKAVFAGDSTHCPAGATWYYPAAKGVEAWVAKGQLSLSALASELGTDPAAMIALTIQHAGQLQPVNSGYINTVFAASPIHVPAGVVVYY